MQLCFVEKQEKAGPHHTKITKSAIYKIKVRDVLLSIGATNGEREGEEVGGESVSVTPVKSSIVVTI
jgi:hypothetical protein